MKKIMLTEKTVRNIETVMKDLEEVVSTYNTTEEGFEKLKVEGICQKLLAEYNETSLFNAYTRALATDMPLRTIVEEYCYNVASFKDEKSEMEDDEGNSYIVTTRLIVTEDNKGNPKTKPFEVSHFIDFAKSLGRVVCNSADWQKRSENARKTTAKQWTDFIESEKAFGINKMKKSLQSMVDGFIFIEGSAGGNAFVVNSHLTRSVIAFVTKRKAGTRLKDGSIRLNGEIATSRIWEALTLDILHSVCKDKDFTITYGEPEAAPETAPVENK